MVKVFALIPRRTDLDLAEFSSYWRDPHAGLATGIETMRRYVQCHQLELVVPGLGEAAYDGIAEVWFEDLSQAQAMSEHPVYVEKVQPDEPKFIDTDRLGFIFTDEITLTAAPEVAVDDELFKLMILARRPAEVGPQEFASCLHGRHAESGVDFDELIQHAQSVALPINYADGGEPPCDGIEELWWSDRESFDRDWLANGERFLESLDSAADRDRCSAFACEEYRVIWS